MNSFSPSAHVRPTTQSEVLEALVLLIQQHVAAFASEATCFVTLEPWPDVEINDNVFCTVSPSMSAQYDQSMVDGAGNLGVSELAPIVVTMWSRIETDQLERSHYALLDSQRGLFSLKRQVLRTLAGKNLDGGTYQGSESLLLLESMSPTSSRLQTRKADGDFQGISVEFDIKFNWDLGSDSENV